MKLDKLMAGCEAQSFERGRGEDGRQSADGGDIARQNDIAAEEQAGQPGARSEIELEPPGDCSGATESR